ncbi:MAG: molybdopterin-synthase adenylyltransferase MoeB [Cytophagales bacterium]
MDKALDNFTQEELKRYNRHFILEGFGIEAQKKLKKAKVLVVGAGGLGCPALQYLTAAGVGHITIIDPDVVSESNLHRQILYSMDDLGKSKAKTAKTKLSAQNPHINLVAINESLNTKNAIDLFSSHDVVVDGTDNFASRYLSNDASVISGKPLVYGAIHRFQGQVAVFNLNGSATYRCLFPEPPDAAHAPDCSTAGVIGVLPGVIGTMQANECIKVITGIGEPLINSLLIIDLLKVESQKISFNRQPESLNFTRLMDNYEMFCSSEKIILNTEPKTLSCHELNEWMENNKQLQLLDVREAWEREICDIGGLHVPLGQLSEKALESFETNNPTVVYCHHGIRSHHASKWLIEKGFRKVYNLQGGIHAWALEINEEMETY